MNIKRANNSVGGKMFDGFNVIFLTLISIISFIPFIYIIAGSFATEAELATRGFFLIPREYSVAAYELIFSSNTISRALMNSIFITLVGTIINMAFTMTMAYPLSKSYIMGRTLITNLIIFCMLFSGGMIPTYLVVRELGLLNKYWALWLPIAISPFNLFIIRNFFQQLPQELEQSAKIDGCSDLGVFWEIVLPLSKPVIATFTLFYAVGHWNQFFNALIYITDNSKWPLQVILRNLVILSSGMMGDLTQLDREFIQPPEQAVEMAVIVVATVPILMIYPFLQKHFAKGVLIGSLKG